jgi:O-antigen/teichoic acid export membrane protein
VVKNSGYLLSANGISAVLSTIQGVLAANLLGVENFGLLGIITQFTTVINKLSSFRMDELVVKYLGYYGEMKDHQRAAAVFKGAALLEMLASVAAFGLVWFLAPVGARYFGKDPSLAHWFAIYGLIILANLISESSTGLLQIYNRFRALAILNVVQSLITLSLIALAYLRHGGLLDVLLAYFTGKIVGALSLTLLAQREATRRWGTGWWRTPLSLLYPQLRELAGFAISTNISATLSLVTKDSELLWIAFFTSPLQAGFYKLALSLSSMVQMPVAPLPQATYPELSREVARKNWGNVRYILQQGSTLAGGYSLLATLGLVLLGKFVISTLSTPEYLPAYPALVVLMLGYLVANTFYWSRPALLALNRPDFPTKLNLVLAICKAIGVILLVPLAGDAGFIVAAALMAGSYIFGVSIAALKVHLLVLRQEQVLAT